jgi:hypothetical protein
MKLKEFKSNMNKTQKYFFIVGVMSFLWFLLTPFGDPYFFLAIGSGLGYYLFKDD